MLDLHASWVAAAGGVIEDRNGWSDDTSAAPAAQSSAAVGTVEAVAALPVKGMEVSPLLSYAGEGLEQACPGRTFSSGSYIE